MPDKIDNIGNVKGIFIQEENDQALAEPRYRSSLWVVERPASGSLDKYRFFVEVTDPKSQLRGQKLPVGSRYGKINPGDQVIFEIRVADGQPQAQLVHPK